MDMYSLVREQCWTLTDLWRAASGPPLEGCLKGLVDDHMAHRGGISEQACCKDRVLASKENAFWNACGLERGLDGKVMASGAVKSAIGPIKSIFQECHNWCVQEGEKQMQIALAARKMTASLKRKNEKTEKQIQVLEEDEIAASMAADFINGGNIGYTSTP